MFGKKNSNITLICVSNKWTEWTSSANARLNATNTSYNETSNQLVHELLIQNLSYDHVGEYNCENRELSGLKKSTYLFVNGK